MKTRAEYFEYELDNLGFSAGWVDTNNIEDIQEFIHELPMRVQLIIQDAPEEE